MLTRPYPYSASLKMRWVMCIGFSLFVFLFLFIFKPFGLDSLGDELLSVSAIYGLLCFMVMFPLNIVLVRMLPNYFKEPKWTTGKEILWSIINVILVGIVNAWYTSTLLDLSLNPGIVLTFIGYALAVGVFPVTFLTLFHESALSTRFEKRSSSINENLHKENHHEKDRDVFLVIESENKDEQLRVQLKDLFYVRSADNYVKVYYRNQGEYSSIMLRNSLKQIEEQFKEFPFLLRCHKSYFVNLGQVDKVSGNAQGFKLHFKGFNSKVPVSRKLNDKIFRLLNT